jgi:hypothetical protein
MTAFVEKAGRIWAQVAPLFGSRKDRGPIASVAGLADFVASRSAYIAQRTLFSYLKTRMGIRYPQMFQDTKMAQSIDAAKVHVAEACLSDLSIFAASNAAEPAEAPALARYVYTDSLRTLGAAAAGLGNSAEDFERRLSLTDWAGAARDADNFTASPRALLRWAPIADELKRYDGEIVQNSIRYAWRDVREQFRKRIDPPQVQADWRIMSAR